MRGLAVVIFWSILILGQAASAQSSGRNSQPLAALEKQFMDVAVDVFAVLRGIIEKGGAEYACVDSAFRGSFHLAAIFSHYKFSVAIRDILKDQEDIERASTLLKIQTELLQTSLKTERERINMSLGTCSRFPVAVAKGTEVLTLIRKGEALVKSIVNGL